MVPHMSKLCDMSKLCAGADATMQCVDRRGNGPVDKLAIRVDKTHWRLMAINDFLRSGSVHTGSYPTDFYERETSISQRNQ
jgi:hypothetical protein